MPDLDSELRRPWALSNRFVPRVVVRPLQDVLQTSSASAALLLAAALVALVWANSPWADAYGRLWHTEVVVGVGSWRLALDLREWVNEGLMALFFLVVGLEIKREVLLGELRDPRTAVLPALAALGGMIVPALVYLAVTGGGEASRGWGVPMATDIAFALGVLTLAARHAPVNLKPFVLTLAIVDDIGAIVIIAMFYSGGVDLVPLLVTFALVVATFGMRQIGVRASSVYVTMGIALWVATYESGVHPTIAGVAMGLLTPALPFQRPKAVSRQAERTAEETEDDPQPPDADAHQWLRLAALSREAVSPLARVEHALLPWTSFVIVPIFALANAGVHVTAGAMSDPAATRVAAGIVLGLVAGKTIGISVASWLAVRSGAGRLPRGVVMRHVVGAAAVAGIGFTVSLFVAELAFADVGLRDAAKVGILLGSLLASTVGYVLLRLAPATSDANGEDGRA